LAQRAKTDHGAVRATAPLPAALRVAHGIGAALLLLGYVAIHLSNHVAGLWGAEAHLALMQVLRRWYRHPLVEPVLVLLMLAQVGGGMLLLRGWLSRHADMQRMLQVATGAYLGLYVICHLNSTFVYARAAEGTDTNFWFASGGPAGLFGDAWSVRLLPHYAIGVLALVLHVNAGLRVVMLAHGASPRASHGCCRRGGSPRCCRDRSGPAAPAHSSVLRRSGVVEAVRHDGSWLWICEAIASLVRIGLGHGWVSKRRFPRTRSVWFSHLPNNR
jgi:hypothetical protein